MQPTSLVFILFFIFSLSLYYLFPYKGQKYFLALINLIYISSFGMTSTIAVFLLSLAVYFLALVMDNTKTKNTGQVLFIAISMLILSLVLNKYIHLLLPFLDFKWLAPVGISFYTFKAISYCVEVYKGNMPAEKNFIHCWIYFSFFPVFTAGPINRPAAFFRQLKKRKSFKTLRIEKGLIRAAMGMFEKVVIADNLLIIVNTIYDQWQDVSGGMILIAMIFYSFQIYLDFDAYSNIAIGLSQTLGYKIEENFRTPYLSENISEFWRRWHISLSSWMKDYIYIPLGGNRAGQFRKYLNLMIVFLISGIWHGAAWNYLLWGFFHGLLQIIENLCGWTKSASNPLLKAFKILFNFILVTIIWVFFKVPEASTAFAMISKALILPELSVNFEVLEIASSSVLFILIALAIMILLDLARNKTSMIRWFRKRNILFRFVVYTLMIAVFLIFGAYGSGYDASQFIYIQF